MWFLSNFKVGRLQRVGEEYDKNAENEVMMPKIVSKSNSAHVLKTTVAKQKQRKP